MDEKEMKQSILKIRGAAKDLIQYRISAQSLSAAKIEDESFLKGRIDMAGLALPAIKELQRKIKVYEKKLKESNKFIEEELA